MTQIRSVIVFIILFFAILISGCAKHRVAGVRKVEHSPIRIGIVEEEFVNHFPVEIQHFPTDDKPYLKIYLKKRVKQKVEYQKKSHYETVYQKDVGTIERTGNVLKSSFDHHVVLGFFSLIFSPIYLLIDWYTHNNKKYKDTKYEKIPGSEKVVTQYNYKTEGMPASYVTIALEKNGIKKTDKNGIATFKIKPEMFDIGLKLQNRDNNEVYMIRREKRIKAYMADWHPEAKLANALYSIGATAYKVRKVVVLGGGPYAIAGAIIVEVVSGVIVGYTIDITAKRKSEHYQWSIVRLRN